LSFSKILVLLLLAMLIDYFNGYGHAHSLDTAAQIKIMGEPSLLVTGLWFSIYLFLPSRNYKILSRKKKGFEDLKNLLVSFKVYFVIVRNSSCISTI
jgi:hypothetical protein